MKASDIIQGLQELIAILQKDQTAQTPNQDVGVELSPAQQPNAEQPQVAVTSFVPPLQAKIELLKKAVDVDSIYDQGGDELAQMKKMAGIKQPHPVVQDMAGEDEPLDI